VLFTSPNVDIKKELNDNDFLPVNKALDFNSTGNFGLLNKKNSETKNDSIKQRNISSIDIFFPTSTIHTEKSNNQNQINNNNNINNNSFVKKDSCIIKKLVKLYNNINIRGESNNTISNSNSFYLKNNNNIYHKIPVINNNLCNNNKKEQNYICNNKIIINKKIIIPKSKIINFDNNYNNQSINSFKPNSPKERNKIAPFKKIIVKNKNTLGRNDKMIMSSKRINEMNNPDDKSNVNINNSDNSIIYIKHISPKRNTHFFKMY
jgi:hypothetical protein